MPLGLGSGIAFQEEQAMCRWNYPWLAYASLAIAVGVASMPVPASAQGTDTAPGDVAAEGSSTVEVITGNGPEAEAMQEPTSPGATASDQPATPADVPVGVPAEGATPLSEQGPDHAAQAATETPVPASEPAGAPAAASPSDPAETAAEGSAQATDAASAAPTAPGPDEPLEPVPDPRSSGIVPVETASFNGITPGVSTLDDVQENWGPPKEIANRNAQLMHLYTVAPFERVEVSFVKDRVAAIVIRLDRAFPPDLVAEKLELSDVRPVLVSDELGHVLGQSYPERGVLFAFEPSEQPGTASMKVVQIILEPVNAEAFVLRAETNMESQPQLSLHDLKQAVELDAENARAHWLRARLLVAAGDSAEALASCEAAVRLQPDDGQYRLTRAQVLGQTERFGEALEEAERALSASGSRPHVKARVLCLLGDLLSSRPEPDYQRAIQYHMEAVKTADPLAVSQHPAIRIAAKEVLVDAHLGAAHDIAWGPWEGKEKAVPRWLEQGAAVAKDLVDNENASPEVEFRVATRALAAHVGMRGRADPEAWTKQALHVGQQLIAANSDASRQAQIRWDLGMALYDVVQIYQIRGDHENALAYGKRAIGYLEPATAAEEAPLADAYVLGRLYFRLGAIHAVGKQDHEAAIYWFEKAMPIFEASVEHLAQPEFGRLGETYVSMGVSFWETRQQDRAVRLSRRGVELMERAVKTGSMDPTALEIPYGNLATMARHLGKTEEAEQYLLEAKRHKSTRLQ